MYFFIKIKLQHCVLYYNFVVTSFFYYYILTSENISRLRASRWRWHSLCAAGNKSRPVHIKFLIFMSKSLSQVAFNNTRGPRLY
jgi:hypothetical protein